MDPATITDEFTAITKQLHAMEDHLAFVVDHNELGETLACAIELKNQTDAFVTRVAMQCHDNGVPQQSGQRTVGQYVAARTNTRGSNINVMVRRGKWLRDFPIFADAYGTVLTDSHLHYLRTKLDTTYTSHTALVDDQQFLVDVAATCSFNGFMTACDHWLAHIDPDGKEPKDQLENSRLNIRTGVGGRGEISGSCDAVTRSKLNTAIEHEARKLRTQDKENGVVRTDSQRRIAALTNLVERGFARQDGTHPMPLCNIVMSLKVAEWALATLSGQIPASETVPVHPTDIDGRCELIDGTPIHPFLAVQALGLITPNGIVDPVAFRRYVMNAKSRAIDVSYNTRGFPEWIRTTAMIESRGQCDTLGCEAPNHWLQTDHVQPVHHGGETTKPNAQTQCEADNQAKGATPNLTAWRDRTPPPRRKPPRRRATRTPDPDDDSDDGDGPSAANEAF